MAQRKVAYIYNNNIRKQSDQLPTMKGRATVVQDLIYSYNLIKHSNVQIMNPHTASYDELISYHDHTYIDFIKSLNSSELTKAQEEQAETFGLLYDCPLFENTYEFITAIAGGSLRAAQALNEGHQYAINWFGGWHHAQKAKAEGFCYVNDIVLAIQKLNFAKILYVDLDVHHGDGVEKAFQHSDNVLTLSIHKCSPGFYPGTGTIDTIGTHCINVPLLDGISDASYKYVFENIFNSVFEKFSPDCLVIQCGGDILAGDPLGECNVTLETMGSSITNILACEKPTLFLGGGGYHIANTSRFWTYLTALILNVTLNEDIPSDAIFFNLYTPTFELKIDSIMGRKDYNSQESLKLLIDQIKTHISRM